MWALVQLLCIHFVADFLFQTEKMGTLKSSSNKWLTYHVSVYSICFFPFGWKFIVLTFILHWITDYVTSRLTTICWKKEDYRMFFKVIGADQLIHALSLAATYEYLN